MTAPEALICMTSAPGVALASEIACRSEPGPVSPVLVTVNVAAAAGVAPTSSAAATATKAPVKVRGLAIRRGIVAKA